MLFYTRKNPVELKRCERSSSYRVFYLMKLKPQKERKSLILEYGVRHMKTENSLFLATILSMITHAIPVRTTGLAQTERTDSTAAVHRDIMEAHVKRIPVHSSSYFRGFGCLYKLLAVLYFNLEKGASIFFCYSYCFCFLLFIAANSHRK